MQQNETVPGLFYCREFISKETEKKLIELFEEDDDMWKSVGGKTGRKVIHYGYNYPYNRSLTLTASHHIPLEVQESIIKLFKDHEMLSGYEPDQAIVHKYCDGEGIGKHIDHTKLFDDNVFCITLGTGTDMVFRKNRESERIHVAPRSAYLMSGDARWMWTHEMPRVKRDTPRYSITFRKVMPKYIHGQKNPKLSVYKQNPL